MIAQFYKYVAIDGDGEVTLYKDYPYLQEDRTYYARVGEWRTASLSGRFPPSGKLRLTTNKTDTLKIVLKRTDSGSFYIDWGEKRYGRYSKAPCIITLPQPIVARGKFFREGLRHAR